MKYWTGYPHILDTRQFKERAILEELFQTANEMRRRCEEEKPVDIAKGKILISLFYEPSTRTRFSFESAMTRLGGSYISTENAPAFSSAAKGESLEDTIRVVSDYGDIIVLRHPERGSAERAVKYARIPLINAGDGDNQHPTQSLLDIYTINREIGRVDGLKVGFMGDNKKSRTVRSLAYLLAQQKQNELYFISPGPLNIENDIKDWFKNKATETGVKFYEIDEPKEILPELDVLYVTRLQLERYKDIEGIEEIKDAYSKFRLNKEMINHMKSDSIVLHPLPRVNEIDKEIDSDPRARYFEQSKNGVYMRMALIKYIIK
ncbi:MAG: aspartate carbamoyltransferase [Candidatus Aenigmatarchaeota archaeon]